MRQLAGLRAPLPALRPERKIGIGHGWPTCDDRDINTFLADEEDPDHPYTLEVVK